MRASHLHLQAFCTNQAVADGVPHRQVQLAHPSACVPPHMHPGSPARRQSLTALSLPMKHWRLAKG